MILITVAPVGYRGSWSASIDDRVICPSVRWPLVAAAKALLAEDHAPENETAMRHQGSTITQPCAARWARSRPSWTRRRRGKTRRRPKRARRAAIDEEGVSHPT